MLSSDIAKRLNDYRVQVNIERLPEKHQANKFYSRFLFVTAVCGLGMWFGAMCPRVEAQTAHYVGQPGIVQSGTTLADPYKVFVDSTETYAYVADNGNYRVIRVTLGGSGAGTVTAVSQSTGSFNCSPQYVVADSSGNVYFACAGTTTIFKSTYNSGNSTYTISNFYTGIATGAPRGMAIDSNNNIYIAVQYSGTNNQSYILKCTAGSCSTFYTFPANTSGTSYIPQGLAVDTSGNLYISDVSQQVVFKLSGSTLTNIQSCTSQPSPWSNGCYDVAVDANGVVYSSSNGPAVYKATPNGSGGYINTSIYTAPGMLHRSVGLALNSSGNTLYVTDYFDGGQSLGNGVTAPSTSSTNLIKFAASGQSFGSVAVGTTGSTTLTATFSIDTTGTLGSIAVLTQGVSGLDFANAGTGTCAAGHNYTTAPTTCTVNVTFTPTKVGLRQGAVELLNSSGTPIATAIVFGTGTGPQLNFTSVAQKTLDSSATGAEGLVGDAAGNLYIAAGSAVYKETYNSTNGTYALSTLFSGTVLGSTFSSLQYLAIDAAGNLYLGDGSNGRIIKATLLAGGGYTLSAICSTGCGANELAVDLAGNVYFLSGATSAVDKLTYTPQNGTASYSAPTVIQSNGNNPWGIAIDSSGNIYYTAAHDTGADNSLYKLTPSGSGYVQTTLDSTLSNPVGISLDASGNIYVAQYMGASGSIVKETYSSGTTYNRSTLISSINNPVGVWVDASGNVFATSQASNSLVEIPYAVPPSLTFASTNELATTTTTTSGTNPITLQNVGTAPFTLQVPSTGTNPSVSANFSATGTTNCNLLSTNSSIESLSAGSTCNLTVTFAPTVGGSLSGSLVLLDNNLNAASPNYTTQTIPLSGTGVWLAPTVSSVTPSVGPITGGTTVTITGTYLLGATGVSFGGTAGTIVTDTSSSSLTVTSPVVTSVGSVDVTVTTPGGTSVTSANDKFLYQAMPTVTLAMSYNGNTVGTGGSVAAGNALKLTATVKVGTNAVNPGIVVFCNAAASRCTDVDLLGTAELSTAGTASISFVPSIGSYSYKAVFLPTGDVFTAYSSTSTLTVTAAATQPTSTALQSSGVAGNYTLTGTVTSTGVYPAAGPTGTVNFLDTSNSNANVGSGTLGTPSVSYGFNSPTTFSTGNGPQRHVLFDYNNDGKMDLAVANTLANTVTVYTGNGDGTFNSTAVANFSAGGSMAPNTITAGDFNGDGYQDLAMTNFAGSAYIYLGNGSGGFTLKQTITEPTNSTSIWITAGDFNNDGILDLVMSNWGTNALTVYQGNGDGTFTLKTTITPGSTPYWIALGDFNGDGNLDMALTLGTTTTLQVYLGNGNGTFTLKSTPTVGTNPYGIVSGDFTGDGIADLAVVNNGGPSVTILQGVGDGTFTTKSTVTVPAGPQYIALGDFNGDGIPDLAVDGSGANLTVLTGSGTGTFTTSTATTSVALGQVLVGDLNGDGLSDLIGLNQSGSAEDVLLNGRTWTAGVTVNGIAVAGTGTHTIKASYAGDTNYASSALSNGVSLTGNALTTVTTLSVNQSSPQTYGTAVTINAQVNPYSSQGHTVTGDTVTFKNNGTTVAGCSSVALSSSGQASCTTSALPVSTSNSLTAVFAGDTNFATSTSSAMPFTVTTVTPTVTLSVTSGGSAVTSVTPGSAVTLTATVTDSGTAVTVGTVNFCDASVSYCTDLHLLGTAQLTSAGTAAISFTPGPGSHSYKAVFAGNSNNSAGSSTTSALAVAGSLSSTAIAQSGSVGNYSLTATVSSSSFTATSGPSGTVTFQDASNSNASLGTATLGTPSARTTGFSVTSSPTTGTGPAAVAVADFNGDGNLDFVVANQSTTTLSVFLGNGNGTATLKSTITVGAAPNGFAFGDLNGDGKLDMVVANISSSTVSVLLGVGDGTFTAGATLNVGTYPEFVVLTDLNGDGNLDLVVTNYGSNTMSVFLGNGNGTFTLKGTPSAGNAPIGIAAGDINGDGKIDLVVANHLTPGALSVFLGVGDGTFTAGTGITLAGNYADYVLLGDFNGDGKLDLAVNNQGVDTVVVMTGNGNGTFTNSATLTGTGNPALLAMGDFNGDGKLDIAVGGNVGSAIYFTGKGDGTFNASASLPQTSTYNGLAAGDLNGDGVSDLVAVSANSNNARLILATATQTATATLAGVTVIGSGTHNVDASYGGDSNNAASLSSTTALTAVAAASTSNSTVVVSPGPAVAGSSATVTVTVKDSSGNAINGATAMFSSTSGTASFGTPSVSGNVITATMTDTVAETAPITVTLGGSTSGTLTGSEQFVAPAYVVTVATDPSSGSGTPSNCVDPNISPSGNTNCSLRDAVAAANSLSGVTTNITFSSLFSSAQTILIAQSTPITMTASMNITGPGANLLTIEGGTTALSSSNYQVLKMTGGTSTLSGVTVANGYVANANGAGLNQSGGTLTVTNSTFSGNRGYIGLGGAIYSAGTLTVTNSTFTGNQGLSTYGTAIYAAGTLTVTNSTFSANTTTALGFGGAIYAQGVLTIMDSTFSGNSAARYGGAIFANTASTLTVSNSIFSGDTAGVADSGIHALNGGTVTYILYNGDTFSGVTPSNSISGNPNLSALGYYGGTTQTLFPLPGSPAICAGVAVNGVTTDQRGVTLSSTRYGQTGCYDVGAVQTSYALAFTTSPSNTLVGASLSPTPVATLSENGTGLTAGSASLTMSAAAGTLSGTATQSTSTTAGATAGQASFSGLSISPAESNDTLTATLALTSSINLTATSSSFNITVPTPTITGISPNHGAIAGGTTVTITGTNFTGTQNVYFLNCAGNSTATFTVVNSTTITAVSTADGLGSTCMAQVSVATASGTSNAVAFNYYNATLASLIVSGYASPAILTEGSSVTVNALDQSGNVFTGFTGIVALTSSDTHATLPSAYTFQLSDAGVHTFNVTLNTVGTQSITATTGSVTGSQTGIAVNDAIWVLNTAGTLNKLNAGGVGVTTGIGSSGSAASYGGAAFDNAGDAWSVSTASSTLYFASYMGNGATSYTGGGLNAPSSVAVDGLGYVWVANQSGNTVSEFTNAGAAQSSTNGYGSSYVSGEALSAPSSIAIDQTGGVWVANKSGNTVTHIFGAAAPVVTPLATATMNGTQGTRP